MMSSRASFCVCSLIQRLFVVLLLLSPEASKSFFCIRYPVLRGFHGLFQSHGGRHFSSATDSDDTAHDAIISNTTLNRPLDNLAVSLNGNNRASQRQRIPILEYFPHWVAVNKPAGMTMHAGGPKQKGPQLKSTLKKQLSRKIWLAHRLDHRTSGVLLSAFDSNTSSQIHGALKRADKKYVALLRGNWDECYGNQTTITIDAPLKMSDGTMKDCVTHFTRLSVFERLPDDSHALRGVDMEKSRWMNTACTLVLASPRTGRIHQIRRHCARQLGMPIIGDSQHGDSFVNRFWRSKLDRLALHCLVVNNLQLPRSLVRRDKTSDLSANATNAAMEAFNSAESTTEESYEILNIVAPLPDNFRVFLNTTLPLLETNNGGDQTTNFWTRALEQDPNLNAPWNDVRSGTLGKKRLWQRENYNEE